MIRPASPPSADMETISPEDAEMLARVLARRKPRPLVLTPAEPARQGWIAMLVCGSALVGLVAGILAWVAW